MIVNSPGDTMLCVHKQDAVVLSKIIAHGAENKALLNVCTEKYENAMAMYDTCATGVNIYKEMLRNNTEAMSIQKDQVSNLKSALDLQIKKTKTQKVYKWIAIAAVPIASFFSFKAGLLVQ
jgi:hypothetical protein